MQIGAQMYTVWEHTQDLEGFSNALKKIADIGYKTVQVSGTCPYDPAWLRDELKKNGLKCVITHINPQRIVEETEKVVEEHKVFGCSYIGIGGMPGDMRGSLEGYEKFRDMFLPAAKKMRDLGAKLMYHNHWFEFNKLDGKNVIERIFEDFPEDSIDFTLDLGWAAYAGEDVIALIKKLSGRLPRIHLKDYAPMPNEEEADPCKYLRPIYAGSLDYDAYIKALESAGTEYALVEQDVCQGDPFEALKVSYENVTKRFPNMK